MPGRSSLTRSDRYPWLPPLSRLAPGIVVLSLSCLSLVVGCGSPMEGSIDIDAARQKAIAEGKSDPVIDAPTTPEARKERADRLVKEAQLLREARQKGNPKP